MRTDNKYLRSILFIMAGYLIVACNGNQKTTRNYDESRAIYNEELKIHDEVMPKMGKIMQLQKTLKARKDELTDEILIYRIDSAIQSLESAHYSMMNWMRNITRIPDNIRNEKSEETGQEPGLDPEEMKKIQKSSLDEIKRVKENMNESIRDAESMLEELQI